jgi:hypothetical protein
MQDAPVAGAYMNCIVANYLTCMLEVFLVETLLTETVRACLLATTEAMGATRTEAAVKARVEAILDVGGGPSQDLIDNEMRMRPSLELAPSFMLQKDYIPGSIQLIEHLPLKFARINCPNLGIKTCENAYKILNNNMS